MRATTRAKQARQPRQRRPATPPAPLPIETVDVLVLSLDADLARVRRLDDGAVLGLRAADLRAIIPGLRLTVDVTRRGKTLYAVRIRHARFDPDALALPPRPPQLFGPWPADLDLDHLPADIAADLRARPRDMFEMHIASQVDEELLQRAIDRHEEGDALAAYTLLMRLAERDLGNLDVHLHLGNLVFEVILAVARSHYEIAVQLGDRRLGPEFDGVLSWHLVGNRAYVRSMHGLGLCQWRAGDFTAAERTFRRMLRLCPEDGVGARILLADVRARKLWNDFADDDLADNDVPF